MRFDVRTLARRAALGVMTAGMVAGAVVSAGAQVKTHERRRETNASREARIQRTIDATYAHRWEVFGGGGYLRFRSGPNTQKNNEVSWATSATYYLTPRLGVVGDARGSFGNAHALPANGYGVFNPQINEYTFMGGANYRFYRKEKATLSGEGLVGVGWGIFSGGSKAIPSTALGLWPDGIRPAFSLGLHADYNFYPNLAFRVTPTWVGTTFGGTLQNNAGVNLGVLYRFGHQ